jgi:hypothetical protein
VVGQFFNLVDRLPADDPDRKMMDSSIEFCECFGTVDGPFGHMAHLCKFLVQEIRIQWLIIDDQDSVEQAGF